MSTPNTAPANAYLRTKVLTANPEELRLMLLDGAIKFAKQGTQGLQEKDYEASYNGLSQCRNILLELINTIKPEFDPELAERVRSLYTFMFQELVEASFSRNAKKANQVIELLEYERETWVLLMENIAKGRAEGEDPVVQARNFSSTGEGTAINSVQIEA